MAFEDLKQRQSVAWGSGPFENVAASLADVHRAIVESLHPRPGDEWLDAACGTGELAFLAAAAALWCIWPDWLKASTALRRCSGE